LSSVGCVAISTVMQNDDKQDFKQKQTNKQHWETKNWRRTKS